MALNVRVLGDPILRTAASPVEEVTDELRELIDGMFETMYREDGVGLAAPQVGVSARVIVVDPREEGVKPFALVNPRVVWTGRETEKGEEGCLSLPGLKELVERATAVTVEGLDPESGERRIEAEGLLARILLHEVDHLEGILFIDRVSPFKRRMLMKKWRKLRAEEAQT